MMESMEEDAAYQAGQEFGQSALGMGSCCMTILLGVVFIVALILAIVRKSKAWTIVTIISAILAIILGIVFVIGAGAAGFKAASEAIEEASAEKMFTTDDGLVSIDGQTFWTNVDTGSPDASLEIGNLLREEYLLIITEPKSDFPQDFGLLDYANLVGETMADTLEDPPAIELSNTQINGMNAYQHEMRGKSDGLDIVWWNTYLEGTDHYYQVISWTLQSKSSVALPRLKASALTVREADGSISQ